MELISKITLILDLTTFLLILGSTIVGVLIGALPGLSSGMAIALLLPFTIYLEPNQAIAAMAALYCGGTFGGSITAILINAPGAFIKIAVIEPPNVPPQYKAAIAAIA